MRMSWNTALQENNKKTLFIQALNKQRKRIIIWLWVVKNKAKYSEKCAIFNNVDIDKKERR